MSASTETLSEAYRASAIRVGQLHALIRRGEGDSQEADDLREELDEYWPQLTDMERSRIRGLSADLNMMDRPYQRSSGAEDGENFNEKFVPAQVDKDWDRVLELMRAHPTAFPQPSTAFLKGVFWARLGDLESALLLFEESIRLDTTNSEFAIALFETLVALDRVDEAADRVIDTFNKHKDLLPEKIVRSARNQVEARRQLLDATPKANEAFTRLFEAKRALLQAVREAQKRHPLFADSEMRSTGELAIFAA